MLQLKNLWEEKKAKDRVGAVQSLFKEFCSNSTIHGVRYLAEAKRHWTERIWWIVAFGISLWYCGYSIGNVWNQWRGSPVTIQFSDLSLPISAIPFPAITLCPEAKTFMNVSFDRHPPHRGIPQKEFIRTTTLDHLCPDSFDPPFVDHFGHRPNVFDESVYKVINEMSPNLSYIMHPTCIWQSEQEYCSNDFIPVYTEEGLCYSFNNLNARDIYTDEMDPSILAISHRAPNATHWSLDDGYVEGESDAYPRRICNAKPSSALIFVLCLNDRIVEVVCPERIPGFRFFLHMPGEVPAMTRKYFQVSRLEATGVLIKPTYVSTSDGLRSFDPNQRQCFFSSERKLRFFKVYTQNNCEAECISNYTKHECGCVKFSMPRDNRTRVCGSPKISCYRKAERKMFDEHVHNNPAKKFREQCNCLPSCKSISYDADLDRVNLIDANSDVPGSKPGPKPGPKRNRPCDSYSFSLRSSHVRIFFNNHEVVTLIRSETYTFANFMAICGGLLGLFLGVSTLSIIEFIYFSTLRMYWSFQEWKPKNIVAPFKRRPIKHITFDVPNV